MSPLPRLRRAITEIVLVAAGLLTGIAVLLVLRGIGLFSGDGLGSMLLRFGGGPMVTFVAVLVYRALAKFLDRSEQSGEPAAPASPRCTAAWAAWWALAGVAAAVAGSYMLGVGLEWFNFPVAEQSGILEITEGVRADGPTLEFGVLAIAALVLAPIAEEWLFRGLLFRRILATGGVPEAFAFSAAAFAAIHTNPAGFVIYMWLGVVFAATYRRTGRLWPAVVAHMGNNAFALTLLVAP